MVSENNGQGRNRDGSGPPKPAYEGARFDVTGHCLKHPKIRLCKPKTHPSTKSEEPELCKYVIVRKTCHLCGEHALCNERKLNKKSWTHGNHRPPVVAPETRLGGAPPRGLVGTDIHVKHQAVTKPSKHHAKKPSGRSDRSDSTPPVTPESSVGSGPHPELTVALIHQEYPPPPLPGGEERPVRVRLRGVVPSRNGTLHLPSRGRSQSRPRVRGRSQPRRIQDSSNKECSSDRSGGSHAKPHSSQRGRSKSRAKSRTRGKSQRRGGKGSTASNGRSSNDSGGSRGDTSGKGTSQPRKRSKSAPRQLGIFRTIKHNMRV